MSANRATNALRAPSPASGTRKAPLAGSTVLVVEDHLDSRAMIRQLLNSQGAAVLLAADGGEALDVLREAQTPPDIVLCDVRMPVMDGLEFTRHVRADLRWRRLPIAAVTAYGENKDYLATLEAGFDAHLLKPLDLDDVIAVVRRLLMWTPTGWRNRRLAARRSR